MNSEKTRRAIHSCIRSDDLQTCSTTVKAEVNNREDRHAVNATLNDSPAACVDFPGTVWRIVLSGTA